MNDDKELEVGASDELDTNINIDSDDDVALENDLDDLSAFGVEEEY